MTWQEIDDGTWDKDEGYLSKQKNEKSRMLGIKECEYFSKLIFKSLFSIHDKNFSLWLNSSNHKNTLQKQLCKIKLDLAKYKTFIRLWKPSLFNLFLTSTYLDIKRQFKHVIQKVVLRVCCSYTSWCLYPCWQTSMTLSSQACLNKMICIFLIAAIELSNVIAIESIQQPSKIWDIL